MRWRRPPPLTDCCRPPTWVERIVWRAREWWARHFGKRIIIEFKSVTLPAVQGGWPKENLRDIICSTQPMTKPLNKP